MWGAEVEAAGRRGKGADVEESPLSLSRHCPTGWDPPTRHTHSTCSPKLPTTTATTACSHLAQAIARRAPGSVDMRAALAAVYWGLGREQDAESEWEFACQQITGELCRCLSVGLGGPPSFPLTVDCVPQSQ